MEGDLLAEAAVDDDGDGAAVGEGDCHVGAELAALGGSASEARHFVAV